MNMISRLCYLLNLSLVTWKLSIVRVVNSDLIIINVPIRTGQCQIF